MSNEKAEAALGVPAQTSASLRLHLAQMANDLAARTRLTSLEAVQHLRIQLGIIEDHFRRADDRQADSGKASD